MQSNKSIQKLTPFWLLMSAPASSSAINISGLFRPEAIFNGVYPP